MEKIIIEYPDGSKVEYDNGIQGIDIARKIGPKLAEAALAIEINGEIKDLSFSITQNSKIRIFTFNDKQGKEVFRHSASHIMADAIKRVFPDAILTIGPAVEDGFYYDIDKGTPFIPEDMAKVEEEIKKINCRKFRVQAI